MLKKMVRSCAQWFKGSGTRQTARRSRPARRRLELEYLEDRTLLSGYALDFSSYLGGNQFEQARDVASDSQGNMYVSGGTRSTNFPDSPLGSAPIYRFYANGYDPVANPSQASTDIFICKFNPQGVLQWTTLVGGPNYDRTYGIEIAPDGDIVAAGRAGQGFYLKNQLHDYVVGGDSSYGDTNAFAFRLSGDGTTMRFSTYTGSGDLSRDMAVDSQGDIYLATHWNPTISSNPGSTQQQSFTSAATNGAFAGKFINSPLGGVDSVIVKIKGDGSQVLWARYVGDANDQSHGMSIRVGPDGSPYLMTTTALSTGQSDIYLVKLSPDGTAITFESDVGTGPATGTVGTETHHLWLDSVGNAYLSVMTQSPNIVTTTGKTYSGNGDIYIAKVSPTGTILNSTYWGGASSEGNQGIAVDALGNVYFSGSTKSTGLAAGNAFDSTYGGGTDGYVVQLSPDLATVQYMTYLGGASNDEVRALWVDPNGTIYAAGQSDGAGWPAVHAHDPSYNPTSSSITTDKLDAVIARFSPVAASAGSLQFSLSGYNVSEGVGTATLTVNRVGGSAGAVTVNYATSDGTATGTLDYTPISGLLSWADGVTASKSIKVRIKEDALVEGIESFTVTLSNATGGATLGSPAAAVVTITDNDGVPVTTQFYSTAGDGRAEYFGAADSGGGQTQWDTARHAATGGVDHTSPLRSNWAGSGMLGAGSTSGAVSILRGFLAFDTSAIPDNAVITSATVRLFVTGKRNDLNDGKDFLAVVQGFQASPSSLTGADYAKAGNAITSPIEGSSRVDITGIATGGYVSFNLNASGLQWISKTGFTQLAVREGHDLLDDLWPGYSKGKGNTIDAYMSEQGLAFAPYLQVTYA